MKKKLINSTYLHSFQIYYSRCEFTDKGRKNNFQSDNITATRFLPPITICSYSKINVVEVHKYVNSSTSLNETSFALNQTELLTVIA